MKNVQMGSMEHNRTTNTNPILERIIKEESAVKKIIYNTIEVRNVKQSSYLTVDDIYQDICILAMDYEKVSKRMGKMYVGEDIMKYFYGSIKMFAIDCVLKEQRRLHKFRMSSMQTMTQTDEHGNKQRISTLGYRHTKQLSHPTFAHRSELWLTIQQTLTQEDFEIFTLHYSGFTIAEISKRMGKACQYALTKIKKQLADELAITE